jgi:hypothetical protein
VLPLAYLWLLTQVQSTQVYCSCPHSSALYCRLLYSCAYDNSTPPHSTVISCTCAHPATVHFRTLPSFIALVRIQQRFSSALYCRLLYSYAYDNSTLPHSTAALSYLYALRRTTVLYWRLWYSYTYDIQCTLLACMVLVRMRHTPYSTGVFCSRTHTTCNSTVLALTVLVRIQHPSVLYWRLS